MIVRRFLSWSQTASAGERAEGVSALARAYLYSPLGESERRESEAALTSVLDDPSPLVRRALAEAFASALDAPPQCVITLANDQSDIASLVLGRSPLLSDSELIDCAAVSDAFAQSAIALRPGLSAAVAAALAEVGHREALIALAVNPGADLVELSMRRMLQRFGEDGELREALLSRPDLPTSVRTDLVAATASSLMTFVTDCGWLSAERSTRIARDASERALVAIGCEAADEDRLDGALEFVRHLRKGKRLTPALLLRALLCGDRSLFEASLVELAGLPASRVAGLVRFHGAAGFSALYGRAGMPSDLLPAFKAALAAQDAHPDAHVPEAQPQLVRVLVDHVLHACAGDVGGASGATTAMLRRFAAEAAQEDARVLTARMTFETARRNAAPAFEIDLAAIEAELALAA